MWTALLIVVSVAVNGGDPANRAPRNLAAAGRPTPETTGEPLAARMPQAPIQELGPRTGPRETGAVSPADEEPLASPRGPRIAWYPSLAQARAEAARTGQPILLQSAAPQCQSVPGLWCRGYRELEGRDLSDPRVVELSRAFVCVRPNAQGDPAETAFLKALSSGRGAGVETTAFCLLASDGVTRLSRAGRSPAMVFGDDAGWVGALERHIDGLAAARASSASRPVHPAHEDVALALNVAACDGLPLVLLAGGTARQRAGLEGSLASLAFSEALVGRLIWGTVAHAGDAARLERGGGALPWPAHPELWLVRAEPYGRGGEVVERYPLPAEHPTLWAALGGSLAVAWESAAPRRAPTVREHLAEAERLGIRWGSESPLTEGRAGAGAAEGSGSRRDRRRF